MAVVHSKHILAMHVKYDDMINLSILNRYIYINRYECYPTQLQVHKEAVTKDSQPNEECMSLLAININSVWLQDKR